MDDQVIPAVVINLIIFALAGVLYLLSWLIFSIDMALPGKFIFRLPIWHGLICCAATVCTVMWLMIAS